MKFEQLKNMTFLQACNKYPLLISLSINLISYSFVCGIGAIYFSLFTCRIIVPAPGELTYIENFIACLPVWFLSLVHQFCDKTIYIYILLSVLLMYLVIINNFKKIYILYIIAVMMIYCFFYFYYEVNISTRYGSH